MLGTRVIALSLTSESSLSFWEKQHREIRAIHEKPRGNWGPTGGTEDGSRTDRPEKVISELPEEYSKL